MAVERLAAGLADRYRLERELGAGGMATVHLAHDLKHDRKVAIKVLHPELSAVLGAERFLTEIKTTANLQHPHILGLIDSGEAGGLLYYVMPFVEGETLRAKLEREQQLSVAESVRLATQVASALEYAHKRGVVHRDIKPENILLQDGQALVADFGIALAVQQSGGQRMTQTGLSLGTPSYMSPEQAMGEKTITARSDVYALGAMTYEMLQGDPPFAGSSAQAIIAQILTAQPRSLREFRPNVPPHVEAAILTALQKLPADRFASAAEFAAALAAPGHARTMALPSASPPAATRWKGIALGAGMVALGALALAVWAWRRPVPDSPVRRYAISLGSVRWSGDPYRNGIAISPDGSHIVLTGPGDEGSALWLRRRDALEAAPLAGTAGAVHPFFSPDGTRLGFLTGGTPIRIQAMAFGGAPPTVVADSLVGLDGATWSDDGWIYFDGLTQGGTRGLMRVRESGGPLEQVTTIDTAQGELDHIRPVALPGGRGLLFTRLRRGQEATGEIALLDLKTRAIRLLARGVTARYLAPGWLLILTTDGALLAAPFDLDRLELTGDPVAALDGRTPGRSASVHLDASREGTLVYLTPAAAARRREVVRVGVDGSVGALDPDWKADFRALAVSPDGQRIAASIYDAGEQHIWVKQLPRGPLARLTFEWSPNQRPSWSSDGRQVLYSGQRQGVGLIGARSADGAGSAEVRAVRPPVPLMEAQLSPDGQWLVLRTGAADVLGVRGNDTVPLLVTPAAEIGPAISPDGKWLAYVSNESQRNEVYVRPFPAVQDGKWLVSTGGGATPRWARDGRTLYFLSRDSMAAVAMTPGTPPAFGPQRMLFGTGPYLINGGSYDVLPGDQGFAMIRLADRNDQPELIEVDRLDLELARGRAERR